MDKNRIDQMKRAVESRKEALQCCTESGDIEKKTQLCSESECPVEPVIEACTETLQRIETDQFGKCTECEGEVEPERLELNFTTCVCLDHYSDNERRALERDLELSVRMQQQFLPCRLPEMKGIQVAAHTEPAQIVGGDYFDFLGNENGGQGIVIADVMGKGVAASMLVSSLQTSLRILEHEYANPNLHKLGTRLNELFLFNSKMISFISMIFLRIAEDNHRVIFFNAGHNPMLWYRADACKSQWLKPTGPAIGLTRHARFKSSELFLSSGDILVLYTDGLVEARGIEDATEEFGKNRLQQYVHDHRSDSASEILPGLLDRVNAFSGRPDDDLTAIVLKKV